MPIYINNQEQHNKFWSYEITKANNVKIEWGRIGGSKSSQEKKFNSGSEMQKFLNKKISEKERKGYTLSDNNELKKEEKLSKDIGAQHKINKLLWVDKKGNELKQILQYNPNKYIYVEIMNSWTKTVTRLLLGKSEDFMINGGVTESGRSIHINGTTKLNFSSFAKAVRQYLKDASIAVAEAVKTMQFAAVGARKLFDDDESNVPESDLSIISTETGLASQVVNKFASLGNRVLDL